LSGKVLHSFGREYDDCFATYQNVTDENPEADHKDNSIRELLTSNYHVENLHNNEWAKKQLDDHHFLQTSPSMLWIPT